MPVCVELRCGRCGNIVHGMKNCWYCGHNWFVTREQMIKDEERVLDE